MLRCLLPPPAGSPNAADADGAEAHDSKYACPLAAELGAKGNLSSHYSGVFNDHTQAGTTLAPTEAFARRLLRRSLNATCTALGVPLTSPCEPAVLLLESYSAGIEPDPANDAWVITDESEPIWAESNWPAEMHVIIYPHGAPRVAETVFLFAFAIVSSALTYAVVLYGRRNYGDAYKRL